MTRLMSALAVLLTLAPAAVGAQGAPTQALKIAYVDSDALLERAQIALEARNRYEEQADTLFKEIEQMKAQWDSMLAEYQRQQGTMTPEARNERERQIANQQQLFQLREQQIQQEAQALQLQLIQPVYTEIGEVVEQIRVEGGYSIILDAAGQSILAADPALDLTEQVLERLNARANAGAGGGGNPSRETSPWSGTEAGAPRE